MHITKILQYLQRNDILVFLKTVLAKNSYWKDTCIIEFLMALDSEVFKYHLASNSITHC